MSDQASQATPHDTLMERLMDSRVAKNELGHAAAREVEDLRELIAELEADRDEWRNRACEIMTGHDALVERTIKGQQRRIAELEAERDELADEWKSAIESKAAAVNDWVDQRTKLEAENKRMREWMWVNHGCGVRSLYGDDGEMQCNNGKHRPIDFKRESITDILAALADTEET